MTDKTVEQRAREWAEKEPMQFMHNTETIVWVRLQAYLAGAADTKRRALEVVPDGCWCPSKFHDEEYKPCPRAIRAEIEKLRPVNAHPERTVGCGKGRCQLTMYDSGDPKSTHAPRFGGAPVMEFVKRMKESRAKLDEANTLVKDQAETIKALRMDNERLRDKVTAAHKKTAQVSDTLTEYIGGTECHAGCQVLVKDLRKTVAGVAKERDQYRDLLESSRAQVKRVLDNTDKDLDTISDLRKEVFDLKAEAAEPSIFTTADWDGLKQTNAELERKCAARRHRIRERDAEVKKLKRGVRTAADLIDSYRQIIRAEMLMP